MHLEFRIKNTLSELPEMHRRIDELQSETGLSREAAHDVKLVLEEVLTNIIKYGYTDHKRHYIGVSATVSAMRNDCHVTLQVFFAAKKTLKERDGKIFS